MEFSVFGVTSTSCLSM